MTRLDVVMFLTLTNTAAIITLAAIQARQHHSGRRITLTLTAALVVGLTAGTIITVVSRP